MQTTHNRTREPLYAAAIFGVMFLAVLAVILFSAVAHAQGVAPAAPAAPGFFATIWSAIASHLTVDVIATVVVPLVLGLVSKYLSAERREQVASAVGIAYHAAVGVDSMLAPGGAKSVLDKIDDVLAQVDSYMTSHGWKPLSDAERTIATTQVQALAGKGTVAQALGAALANPPKAPAAA